MQLSLRGHALPESTAEAELLSMQGLLKFKTCAICRESLSSYRAAYSTAGWRGTQISGTCEHCFDSMFKEDEDAN